MRAIQWWLGCPTPTGTGARDSLAPLPSSGYYCRLRAAQVGETCWESSRVCRTLAHWLGLAKTRRKDALEIWNEARMATAMVPFGDWHADWL